MTTQPSTDDHARRVLIIDDQPDTTATLTVLIAMLGHETRSAHRGREAIRLAKDFDPDLVLLDIGLPDISGYDVVRALRADARRPDRLIPAITGRCQLRDLTRAIEAGFDQYLVKPVDIAKLRALLRLIGERVKPTAPN
jgi:DNA-binding response OmpR family regulator